MSYSDGRERNLLMMGYPQVALFGGEGSATADKNALMDAMAMQQQGASREDILAKTGWFFRPDGKWRYEIDDTSAVMTPEGSKPETRTTIKRLGDVLDHPALYQAYPNIRDTEVSFLKGRAARKLDAFGMQQGNSIWLDADYPYHNPRGLLDTLLHEVQHKIQEDDPLTYGEMSQAYGNRPGEVESRNVEKRALFSPEQRRSVPPWRTEDTAEGKQSWPRPPFAQNLLMQGY